MTAQRKDDARRELAQEVDPNMDAQNRQAELNAQVTIARLIDRAKDPETADKVLGVWVDAADRIIGRSVRRILWYLLIALAGIVAAKMGLIEKLFPGGGK